MTGAILEQRRRLFLAEVSRIVPGLYGWLATVLLPVLQRGASSWSRAAALLALGSLIGSFLLSATRPRASRVLGVYGFVFFCFGTWAFLGALLRSDQLDAVRGALGAVGFLLHALAWGAPPKNPDVEALDNLVPGVALQPRQKPTRLAAVALALGIAVALVPMAVAFGVERPGASLLAHALALACSVLVIGVSTDISLRMGKAIQFPAWRARVSRALWPLGGLIVAVGIGLIWLALR